MRYKHFLMTAGLAISMLAGIGMAGPAEAAEDEYYGLPDSQGRDEVAAYCSACHSLGLVAQQGQTRSGWSEMLTWMYDEQEMEALEPEDEKLVLDYLAKYVGPDTQKERLKKRGLMR